MLQVCGNTDTFSEASWGLKYQDPFCSMMPQPEKVPPAGRPSIGWSVSSLHQVVVRAVPSPFVMLTWATAPYPYRSKRIRINIEDLQFITPDVRRYCGVKITKWRRH